MAPDSYTLQQFQTDFLQAITTGQESEQLLKEIIPAGTLADGSVALAVHRDGYRFRLTEALGETFEGVWFILGDSEFFNICREYIFSHPSTTYNLSHYGDDFPAFLASLPKLKEQGYLPHIARLDWAFRDIFHTADHRPIPMESLSSLTVEELEVGRFIFGPGVNLIKLDYPLTPIWQSRQGVLDENADLSMLATPQDQFVLLYKSAGQVFISVIDQAIFRVISLLMVGHCAGEVAALAAERPEEYDLEGAFEVIGATGIVTNVSILGN